MLGQKYKFAATQATVDRHSLDVSGNKCVKSDVRFLIFGEIFLLLAGRKSIFLSASRSQFVAIGPATILKINQRITFLWPK